MAALYTPSFFQPQNINGVPLAGAKLFFYQTGTTTPITIYQNSGLTTPHANPVVADASGIFPPIYTSAVKFKTVLKTSADVTVQTVDPVFGETGALATTDNAIARFNGTTGALQNSDITIDDNGVMSIAATRLIYTNATQISIAAGTLDGADTSRAHLCGGGSELSSRGAVVAVYGNEVAAGLNGRVRLVPGVTAVGANAIGLEGDTTLTGDLAVTGAMDVDGAFTGAAATFSGAIGGTTGTFSGAMTAASFTGSGAALTNIGTPIAGLSLGGIGTYALCRASGSVAAGATVAGSTLTYTGASGDTAGGNPGGTWRAMGAAETGSNGSLTTLFLRIS